MTKDEIYAYTRRFYARLKRDRLVIRFKKSKKFAGMWYGDGRIEVDPLRDLVPSIIHELLHDIHQDKSEKWVTSKEREISNQLSYKQIKNLLQATAAAIRIGD